MRLKQAAQYWNEIGHLDPCWAVLVEPTRKYGGWETEEGHEEFFRTGETEIANILAYVEKVGGPLRAGRALDFGCGVGRLTRALAGRFERCDGVDISEAMVERARDLHREYPNCTFHVNTHDHLELFEDDTFDFIYTSIVLQHVPSREIIKNYIREFVRVLRPGGVLAFQLPSHIPLRRRIQPRRRLYAFLRTLGLRADFLYRTLGLMPMQMSFIPEREVLADLGDAGAEILNVQGNTAAGPEIESRMYFVTKRA